MYVCNNIYFLIFIFKLIYNENIIYFKGFIYAVTNAKIGFMDDVLVFFNQRLITLTNMFVQIVNGIPLLILLI